MTPEQISLIVGTCVALIVSAITYCKSYIENKKLKEELKSITDAIQDSDTAFYIVCPKCGYKIYLKDVNIRSDENGR